VEHRRKRQIIDESHSWAEVPKGTDSQHSRATGQALVLPSPATPPLLLITCIGTILSRDCEAKDPSRAHPCTCYALLDVNNTLKSNTTTNRPCRPYLVSNRFVACLDSCMQPQWIRVLAPPNAMLEEIAPEVKERPPYCNEPDERHPTETRSIPSVYQLLAVTPGVSQESLLANLLYSPQLTSLLRIIPRALLHTHSHLLLHRRVIIPLRTHLGSWRRRRQARHSIARHEALRGLILLMRVPLSSLLLLYV